MKILFVYPDIITPMINFCPAVHSLSAFMRQHGHECTLIHINDATGTPYRKNSVLAAAGSFEPDLIAVTSTSFNYRYAEQAAEWLKGEYPDVPVILGGSHATVEPDDIARSSFDAFCVGEGEYPLLDICRALQNGTDWKATPNLVTLQPDGTVLRNPVRGFLRDLDSLPFLDFDITDTVRILDARQGWFSISFSRGCPFECSFCINHIYKQRMLGPEDRMSDYIRKRSPENTVDELESLARKYRGHINVFNFDDDLLPMDRDWMRRFGELYRKRVLEPFGIKYAINCRATFLDRDMARLFSDSGCLEVRIGFETGNEKQRMSLLAKKVSDRDLLTAFSACDEFGVHTNAFTMMGLPDESEDTFRDTVAMVLKLKPYLIRMTFLYPYAHTRIYDLCMERNIFKPGQVHEDSFTETPLVFDNLTDEQIFCFRFLFPWYVNVEWFGDTSEGSVYRKLIAEYESKPIEELRESIPAIIEKDRKAADLCDRPRFQYFGGNAYYFQLHGKYDSNERTVVSSDNPG